MRDFFAFITGIATLLLGTMVVGAIQERVGPVYHGVVFQTGLTAAIFTILKNVVIPILAGGMTGWLARRGGARFAFSIIIPLLPLLALLFLVSGMDVSGRGSLQVIFTTISWSIFLPIGGFLGEKLYWALYKS